MMNLYEGQNPNSCPSIYENEVGDDETKWAAEEWKNLERSIENRKKKNRKKIREAKRK